ncbi:aldo/keto reductase [Zunongwangia atlantica]|uniref:Aldo/keto reductase n=1 Tax=Zunongwangia atlantica 22II14-10F7 TaxID=1185767 RepID=A0A1Y1SXU0_9FLAO|nr:aldo/keto reductase [Zunongwangia atlantica]ORL43591.1 aldo/keto reductase [Zunongwangia atlantica 22II14-10F7]
MNRRKLLKRAGLVTMASALAPSTFMASCANEASEKNGDLKSTVLTGRRKLRTLEVSAIGMGVQNMHRHYTSTVPYRPNMIKILQAAYDKGVTFYDTAEAYGPFENEKILGEAIQSFRNNVVITSKFGWNIDLETGQRLPGLNSKPEHIKLAVEGMLKRLKTDRIDLLYQHRVDPEVPIEDVAGAVKQLMDEGKVLHWGLSEPGVQTVRRAHAELPLTAIQNEYSMIWRGPENDIIPLCEELGIGFVPWWPLACQLLTGSIDEQTRFAPTDIRANTSRYAPENLPQNLKLVEVIKTWGMEKNATPAQIALAWLQAQKPFIVPIPGTTQMAHMEQNIKADNIKFTTDELFSLNEQIKAIDIKGLRLPEFVLQFSNVEAPKKN